MDFSTVPTWMTITAFAIIILFAVLIIAYSVKLYITNGTIKIGSFTISKQALKTQSISAQECLDERKTEMKHCFSWQNIEEGIKNLQYQLVQSMYNPTLIVGIGRGGAIMCGLLSGSLNHLHFIALEREYDWKTKKRNCKIFNDVTFSQNLERILLVAGDLVTGETADKFTEFLIKQGAQEIKFMTLIKLKSCIKIPDYFYVEIDSCDFRTPWMLSDNYLRDSRNLHKA